MNTALEPRTVGELMTPDPILAHVDMTLSDAADLMDFYRVTGLPVVDGGGALCGVISQTDLLHARTTESLWAAWPGLAVRHLMTAPAVTVTSGTSIDEAAALMERLRIHRVVVTDPSGETVVGILAVADLVRSMAERGPG